MPRAKPNDHAPGILFASLAALSLAATPAIAQWPSSPAESIEIGVAEGTFLGPRQTLASTPGSTWLVWQRAYCVGDLRLNRITRAGELLAEGGIPIQPDPTCGFVTPPLVAPLDDAVVATRNLSGLDQFAVNRFGPGAVPEWQPGFTTAEVQTIGNLTALPSGDIIAASAGFDFIRLDRLAPDGMSVWDGATIIPTISGANFRILDCVPDAEDGFFLLWDSPLAYIRTVRVQRIAADGSPVWAEPLRPVPAPPLGGISRHTNSAALAGANGSLVYTWAKGFEQGTTPAPLLFNSIRSGGTLAFPIEGRRVAESTRRQFDPVAVGHPTTGETDIIWREGQGTETTIRAQRLDAEGNRLWGASGVLVCPIAQTASFDAALLDDELHVVTATDDGVAARQVTDDAQVRGPWPVATETDAFSIALASDPGGITVTWQAEGPELADTLRASRLNRAGRLGEPACNGADLATPFGVLDLADIGAFIPEFLAQSAGADLADPSGVLDLADLQAFVEGFVSGCP